MTSYYPTLSPSFHINAHIARSICTASSVPPTAVSLYCMTQHKSSWG